MFGIFLDTEANGLDPKVHRLIEVAYTVIDLLTGTEISSYHSVIFQDEKTFEKSNMESLKVNGFTYDEVKKGKFEKEILKDILVNFKKFKLSNENAIFICQNPSFDRIFLSQIVDVETQNLENWPYHKDDKNFLPWEIGLSKDSIASFYKIPKEKKPHKAKNGVAHLLLCYKTIVGFPCN